MAIALSSCAAGWPGTPATLPGSMSLLSPNVNSDRRLVELTGPPMTVTWGEDNKSAALRTVTRDPATARIEHRVPSADCNVYLALASALAGGLVGIEDELEPPPELDGMAWMLPPGAAPRLPDSLKRAASALAADRRLAEAIGSDVVEYWLGAETGSGSPSTPAAAIPTGSASTSCDATSRRRERAQVSDKTRDPFVREMLAAPHPCSLTSLDADGRPYGVVVWCALDGDRFTVNAGDGHWLAEPAPRPPRLAGHRRSREHPPPGRRSGHGGRDRARPRLRAHRLALAGIRGPALQYSLPEDEPRYRLTIEPERIRGFDFAPPGERIR